ncbi:hypothetical protein DH2020_033051 [Rehmannia glutinosa]|uniref:Uncharacterized protein n=1 Tax=Rehmannia glutinosa TaxID=99300 RepID=A0ABR0VFS4_REHGL
MGTRTGSHQLSSGLIVSGRPEQQLKERQPTMASRAVIYTGGDVKKSGELGKMYGVDFSSEEHPHQSVGPPKLPSRPPSGSARSGPSSGTLGPKSTNSGPMSRMTSSSSFSGPMTPIQPTGLITSGPLGTSASSRRSGQLDTASAPSSFKKANYGSAVTSLGEEVKLGFRVSRVAMWMFFIVVAMGLVVGAFLMAAVKKAVILVAVVAVLVPTVVVTCGSIPLETSFQKVSRCIYASSELYEYRGFGSKPANAKHRFFSWGCRHSEKHVADFYISDNKSGLRALVKTGYGAKVAPFVKPTVVIDVTKDNKELSPNFLHWLSDRGLSSDDRLMRLKEG